MQEHTSKISGTSLKTASAMAAQRYVEQSLRRYGKWQARDRRDDDAVARATNKQRPIADPHVDVDVARAGILRISFLVLVLDEYHSLSRMLASVSQNRGRGRNCD